MLVNQNITHKIYFTVQAGNETISQTTAYAILKRWRNLSYERAYQTNFQIMDFIYSFIKEVHRLFKHWENGFFNFHV